MKKELLIALLLGLGGILVIIFISFRNPLAKQSLGNTMPTASPQTTIFSLSELAKHNNRTNCWIVINNSVYDVTAYISDHPGGSASIIKTCGTDATQAFETRDGKGAHSARAIEKLQTMLKGTIGK